MIYLVSYISTLLFLLLLYIHTISISYIYPCILVFTQAMNISTSECSSGCESGWTTYLDHLSNSTNPYNRQNYQGKGANVNEDQKDEDLSMVSDASSGPPHLHENYGADPQCYGFASSPQEDKKKSKQKIKTKETRMKQQHNLCLDDTASSPTLHFAQASRRNIKGENSFHFQLSFIDIKSCKWIFRAMQFNTQLSISHKLHILRYMLLISPLLFPSPNQIFTRYLTMFRKKLHQKRTCHSSNHQQKGNQVREFARFFDIRLLLA